MFSPFSPIDNKHRYIKRYVHVKRLSSLFTLDAADSFMKFGHR